MCYSEDKVWTCKAQMGKVWHCKSWVNFIICFSENKVWECKSKEINYENVSNRI